MTPDNSFAVGHRLVALERDYGPYMRGAKWADPDLDEVARFMRLVADYPDEGRARGTVAREQVLRERDPAVTGAIVRQRLEAIRSASDRSDSDPRDPRHPRDLDQ
jgi:hypothetical protein